MPIQRDPTSTSGAGGWTPAVAATLHEALADIDDSSFIECADGSTCAIDLDPAEHPNEPVGTSVTVRVQKAVDTSQTCDIGVVLKFDGVTCSTWTILDVEDTWTDHVLDVDPSELAAFTDLSAPTIEITDAASPLTATNNVARAFLTVPERRLHAHSI